MSLFSIPCSGGGIFLDRDGVINEEVDLLSRPEQLRLLAGAAEAIRLFNQAGRRVIVVTNQSVVARGLATPRQVVAVHRRLRALLAQSHARLDAVYFCPYHEAADLLHYRRRSENRKPGIGMLLKGARRFGLCLEASWMIGDQTCDIEAGRRAGCRTVLLHTGYAGRDRACAAQPHYRCANLLEAAHLILQLESLP